MDIVSLKFLAFVVALLIVYYLIPKKFRWIILLLGSIIFYYLSSKKLICFVLFSSSIIYLLGLVLDKYNNKSKRVNDLKKLNDDQKKLLKNEYKRIKRRYLLLGILLNILFIIVTKYSGFVIENINGILNVFKIESFKISKILLPLGISYYTLEAISYITDIYRGKYPAEHNYFKVLLFLIYFPKITEGPICRYKELSTEFTENNDLKVENITIGLDLIILGVFKKMVIADRAAIYVGNTFGNTYGGITIIVAMIMFTIQLYAEFGGIIDIIRGVSLLFGIRLPLNFKRPFFAKSIQEFWRLWHISLGAWIKEYVFYPISLSKMNTKVCRFCKEKLSNYLYKFICAAFPLLFVWIVNGIWHGASYKYIVYGMYYYVIMMIGLLLKPFTDKLLEKLKINETLLKYIRIIRTIILVVIGMTLFRASTISEFGHMMANIFKHGSGISNLGLETIDFVVLLVCNLFILLIGILEEKNKISIENGFTQNKYIRAIVYTLLICTIVIFGMYGKGYNPAASIYGAF